MSVPITTDDNAKFKLENERNYHLLLKAAFAWIWRLSLRLCTHNKFRQSCLQSKQRGFCPWGQAEPRHTSRWAEPLRMEEVYAISSYFWHLSQFLVISWPNRGSRNSIWSISHLTLRRTVPRKSSLYCSGPSVCMMRAGLMQESVWKKNKSLVEPVYSVAADESRRITGGWRWAWRPHRLPFFLILPLKAGNTQGHISWITRGDHGGRLISDYVCCKEEQAQNDRNTHFDCNVSSAFCARVTCSSREHLL